MVKNSGLYPSVVAESGDVPAGGLAGGEAADRNHPGHEPGRLAVEGSVVVAGPLGGARPGQDHGGPGGVRGPGRPVPVGCGPAAMPGGGLRAGGLRPHSLSAGGDPGRPRRGGRGRREPGPHSGAAAGVGPGRSGRPHGWCLGGPPVGDRRRRHLG